MHRIPPLILLAICAWWGFHQLGPVGIFWGWLGWGFVAFIYYAVKDMTLSIVKFFDPSKPRNVNLTVYKGETITGRPLYPDVEGKWNNVDPTRPTEEDFAGLLTVRISKHERGQ
jgi:hypothetical protein